MRNIMCKDCGKRYDYDKDDFCPKCGVYNSPQARPSTQLEQELLARFAPAREGQSRAKGQQQARHQAASRPAPGTAVDGRQRHGQRIEDCRACGPEVAAPKPRRGLTIAIVVIVVVVGMVGSAVASVINTMVEDAIDWESLVSSFEPAAEMETHADDEDEFFQDHELLETFQVNDVEISIDDVWWVELSGDDLAEHEGYDCLAVDVWITGGERRDDLYIDTPELVLLSDYETYSLVDDIFLSKHLSDHYGVYPVTLSDYQWEDPLYGQLIFFLPEGSEGEADLLIEEYAPGDTEAPELTAVHTVYITLP